MRDLYFGQKALVFAFLLAVLTLYCFHGYANSHMRAVDDMVAYKISFKPHEEGWGLFPDSQNRAAGDDDEATTIPDSDADIANRWVPMMSADQEEYQCLLPTHPQSMSKKKQVEAYFGPSPTELLKPLYSDSACSYRIESYWVYEVCHGRYVLQYHENKESKIRAEYYLGNYAHLQAEAEADTFDPLNPGMRKIGEEQLSTFPVTYIHGTLCDLTGQPRVANVLYACDPEGRNHIYSINEISSCNYEIIILTNLLCTHPSFQKEPSKELEVQCFAKKRGDNVDADMHRPNPKPQALTKIEKESSTSFFREFSLHRQSAADIFRNLIENAQEIEIEGMEQLNTLLAAMRETSEPVGLQKPPGRQPPLEKVMKPADARKMIENFWKGKHCLRGGAGWWKYEFCYGQVVKQYHEEQGKPRQEIVLGLFNEERHKNWADLHPHKARKVDEGGKVYQVSNFYSEGDMCTEAGARRTCEVRMRCPGTGSDTSSDSSKVLIYLIEPETCNYVLVMESGLFCEGLAKVNNYGLLDEMPSSEVSESELGEEKSALSESQSVSTYTETKRAASGDQSQEEEENEEPSKVRIVRVDKANLRDALKRIKQRKAGQDQVEDDIKLGKLAGIGDETILEVVKTLLPEANFDDSDEAEEGNDASASGLKRRDAGESEEHSWEDNDGNDGQVEDEG